MFGKLLKYEVQGQKILFQYEEMATRIEVISDEIINVFAGLRENEQRSKAIEGNKVKETAFSVNDMYSDKGYVEVSTDKVICRVCDDFKVDFFEKDGTPVCLEYRGKRSSGQEISEEVKALLQAEGHAVNDGGVDYAIQSVKCLGKEDCIYGLGDKTGFLNKRNYEYENWNSDIPDAHEEFFRSLYKSIPFFMVHNAERTYGIFFDNTFKSYFNFGKENSEYIVFGSDEGNLDYYYIAGDSMADIIGNYTYLTGRAPMQQKWVLGYHQSRWGYSSEEEFRYIANTMRECEIPLDGLHFDIDYMEKYKVFTWNQDRFPTLEKLLQELKDMGVKPICIIDPGVKVEEGYNVYEEGIANDYYAKTPEGDVYVNEVWPGDAVYPDFGKAEVRKWWGAHHKFLLDKGIRGVWNDMNEPASFRGPLPDDVVFTDEDRPALHKEMHNVYGHNMAKATYEGLKELSGKRPFLITRACYAGSQKYSTVWTGDNQSLWNHLRMAVPQQCNLGMSGLSFVGTDIGGFGSDCTPELMARWIQVGVFSPLCRNHSAAGTKMQEPWRFSDEIVDIYRKYVNLRYELLPYLYDKMYETESTGLPMIRPLVLHYPKDKNVWNLNDEFMLGENLLVAPVVEQGATRRMVYLPEGTWYDYWTKEEIKGGQYFIKEAPLDVCPIYVKAGTVLPKYPKQMYVGEIADKDLVLTLEVYPGEGSYVHYYDNGEDFAYREGEYNEYLFENKGNGNVDVKVLHKGYMDYADMKIVPVK